MGLNMLKLIANQKQVQIQNQEHVQSNVHAELLSILLLSIKKNKNALDFSKFPSWIQHELLDLAECIHRSYQLEAEKCTEEDVQEDF